MDLTNQEKRSMRRVWVNVYQRQRGGPWSQIFSTQEEAETIAKPNKTWLCTCPIEIPDLEGK